MSSLGLSVANVQSMTVLRTSRHMLGGILFLVSISILPFSPGVVHAVATTHYVAASGSVGADSSCSSPGFVGATHAAIQSAINAAASGDTIRICAGTFDVSTRLSVSKSLTIRGAGPELTSLDGGGTTQIMIVKDNHIAAANDPNEITVNIDAIQFRNGNAQSDPALGECQNGNRCGGAIFVENGSMINISDTYFKNNTADFIGGAFARLMDNYPTVPATITDSTFESNKAKFDGGAVATLFGFGLTIERSTFYKNSLLPTWDARSASAIIANFATATINDSTIYDNDAPSGQTVLYGGIDVNNSLLAQTSGSTTNICTGGQNVSGARGNIVTDGSCGVTLSPAAAGVGNSARTTESDLNLGTYSSRGYSTRTIPLLSGSAAIDRWTGCTGNDQHGFARPQGSGCDAGSYERPTGQTSNTVDTSTWSYGASTLYRAVATSFALVAGPVDAAGQGVTYSSSTPGVCTVNASTGFLTTLTAGTCTLVAQAPGYLLRDESSASLTLTISASTPPTTTTTTTTTSTTTVPAAVTTTLVPSSTSSSSPQASFSTATSQPGATATTAVSEAPVTGSQASPSTTVSNLSKAATKPVLAITPTTGQVTTSVVVTTTIPAPDAPAAAPGEAGATVDGEKVATDVKRADNALLVSAGEINTTVYAMDGEGSRIPLDIDGNIRVNGQDSVVVESTGYTPATEVEVWLHSTPIRMAVLIADSMGRVGGKFPVPASISKGDHRVVLSGRSTSGKAVVIGIGLRIGSYGKESNVGRWVIIGTIVLAVIVALVIPTTTRRRRRPKVNA